MTLVPARAPTSILLRVIGNVLVFVKRPVFDKSWCVVNVGKKSPLKLDISSPKQTALFCSLAYPHSPSVTLLAGMEKSRGMCVPPFGYQTFETMIPKTSDSTTAHVALSTKHKQEWKTNDMKSSSIHRKCHLENKQCVSIGFLKCP